MYHLSQEEFFKSWEPIRNGDSCIIAQDTGFLESVRQQWEKPADWCGYQEEGYVAFQQVYDAAEAMKERAELLKTLETEADYIWGQNYIHEEYRSYAASVWKKLQEEAAEELAEQPQAASYTADMDVSEITQRMTVNEATAVVVQIGTCRGWTLEQVAQRRPASLKWYLYGCDQADNILKAAASVLLDNLQQKAG